MEEGGGGLVVKSLDLFMLTAKESCGSDLPFSTSPYLPTGRHDAGESNTTATYRRRFNIAVVSQYRIDLRRVIQREVAVSLGVLPPYHVGTYRRIESFGVSVTRITHHSNVKSPYPYRTN